MGAELRPGAIKAISWLVDEVEISLAGVFEDLQEYRSTRDSAKLRQAWSSIHDVAGSLQLAEVTSPLLLVREMEAVVEFMLATPLLNPDECCTTLFAAITKLPLYLRHTAAVGREAPAALYILANDCRAIRGQRLYTLDAGFSPDLSGLDTVPERDLPENFLLVDALIKQLRKSFQAALLGLLKGNALQVNLEHLEKSCSRLRELHRGFPRAVLWRVAAAFIEGLFHHGIALGPATRRLLRELDRELGGMQGQVREALVKPVPDELLASLLYYIAAATSQTERILEVRGEFDLDSALSLAPASSGQGGGALEASLISALSGALLEELDAFKEAFEAGLARPGDRVLEEQCRALVGQLQRTLRIVGNPDLESIAERLADRLDNILGQQPEAVAELVVELESTLNAWQAQAKPDRADPELPQDQRAEINRAWSALGAEISLALEQVKSAIAEVLAGAKPPRLLAELPNLLAQASGALVVAGFGDGARILDHCARFIGEQAPGEGGAANQQQYAAPPDAITAVEHYLEEVVSGHSSQPAVALGVAERAIQAMGYQPNPLPEPQETVIEVGTMSPSKEKNQVKKTAGKPQKVQLSQDIDPEIREIFVEEAREVLATLEEFFPQWRLDAANQDALTETRRAFHTLKGSGRMVGAEAIGELAWSVESLLNRVLDGRIQPGGAVMAVVDEVIALVPAMVSAFEAGTQEFDHTREAELRDRATRLADGENLETQEAPVAAEAADEDADLMAIFVPEARIHLDALAEFVAAQRDKAPFYDIPTSRLQAALHTLKGSAHMASIQDIAALVTPLERFVKELLNFQVKVDDDIVELLADCGDYCVAAIDQLAAGRVPDTGELPHAIARINELRERMLGPVLGQEEATTRVDPAFLNLLMTGGIQLVLDAEDTIGDWRASAAVDGEQVAAMVAELEQLQEGADKAGFPVMAELGAALAAVYRNIAGHSGALSESAYSALLAAHDALLNMVDAVAANQDITPAGGEVLAALAAIDSRAGAEVVPPDIAVLRVSDATLAREGAAADREIVHLFSAEAEELMECLERAFAAWEQAPAERSHSDDIKRLLHTFKGGARMAGLDSLGTVAHDLESQIVEFDAAAGAGAQWVKALLPFLDVLSDGVARVGALAAAPVVRPVEKAAQPQVQDLADELDEDVVELFLAEADELLEELEHCLQGWGQAPQDRRQGDAIKRNLHTFKGGARMAGLLDIGDLCHDFETLVEGSEEAILGGDTAAVAAMLARYDQLSSALEEVRGTFGRARAPAPAAPVEPLERAQLASREWTSAEILPFTGTYQGLYPLDQGAAADTQQAAQEVVRIPAPMLDMLVNLAGESSISRSQVEQNINEFIFSLDEMEATIRRMQDQVRRLGIETDAQVMFRREQIEASESIEGFDPLEMDRYSQLQQLSRSLLESASDLQDLRDTLVDKSRDAESLLLQQSRINTDLQEGLMRTRMVPFSRVVPRLRRVVRQVASVVGKRAHLHLGSVEGDLDRSVLERIMSPLEHMLRNAIDHGIEDEGVRRELGKDPEGTISISFSREGGDVLIRIADDGRGLDVEAIRAKAFSLGLLNENTEYSDNDIAQFIFHPGFSTSAAVTQTSGRGVGMDVVNSEVRQLGGNVTMTTRRGAGTEFQVRLPFTVSVNRALMIELGEDSYALALNSISGVTRLSVEQLTHFYQNPKERLEYGGESYAVRYLGTLLSGDLRPTLDTAIGQLPMVLIRADDHNYAVQVDALIGSREIVVKTLGAQFSRVPGLSGATVLGDGRVVVILDLQGLLRDQSSAVVLTPMFQQPTRKAVAVEEDSHVQTIMVVDDSVTVRKVTSRFLEREGFRVITARDGVDAMRALQETTPDLMLLDIEMPRMDGFEVARLVRSTQRLKDLPIIMITSRTGDKHRERALAMGVNRYLGKPYQEDVLIREVYGLLTSAETG